ncbi:hypothetical protein ACB092_09G013400 [Castanea dentata]
MMKSVSPLLDYYDHHGIRTTTLNRGERFCGGLTTVLLVLDFMAHIPIIKSGISRTWRSACFATTITRPHQLPWLMLSETPHTHRRRFFSLLNRNRYQLPLSKALCGKRCWGSQHNWVVALGPDYRAHLVPLVKGEPIALPPLDTIRGDAPEEWFCLAHKFILCKDPSHDHHELSFLVFAIFSPMNCLAFARVRGRSSFEQKRTR